jgi:hypothetical protein
MTEASVKAAAEVERQTVRQFVSTVITNVCTLCGRIFEYKGKP